MSKLPEKIPLIILDSPESPSLCVTHHTKYMVKLPSFSSFEWEVLVINTPKGEDLILGFDFLNHVNPSIDWRQRPITFNTDHKDYYDPSKPFSNDLSSAKSCAALVGNSRTPPFPASVNIPSLNSICHYYPLEMKSSKRSKMLEKIVLYLHFISSLVIWTSLLHLIMTPWRSCGMERKSQKK
ncbi:hypothetical protein O181_120873 [Austropuccinia psidii MF-1]|uniref:Uncharacterized protein n=1 Tax=Austropuccinia psidii MF-1 TaxID=1389203 RepID=A0A9Q3KGH8_9BASI|nr:hypothetical protein [Austropuccinia psidii MF-1]